MKKFCALALFLMIAGCEKNVLYPGDSGKTLYLDVGEQFSIKLPENPSTGYAWRIITVPQSQMVISQVADQFGHSRSNVVGAGGERIFQYQATNAGMVEIYGFHSRPWESDSEAEPSFKYQIVVR
ncbi:MAG: protease inhibitor I42 family protein [Alphaproteobacteria bacterium]|nr:protease inhibitor I42 family protein [Alphaproteobacteria bacterium]